MLYSVESFLLSVVFMKNTLHCICLCMRYELKQLFPYPPLPPLPSLDHAQGYFVQTAMVRRIITVMTAQQTNVGHHWTCSCIEALFPPPCWLLHTAAATCELH